MSLLARLSSCALIAAGCSATDVPDAAVESEEHRFRVETFAVGFGVPWGLAFLPDGRLLVTEQEGLLRIVAEDGTVSEPIEGVPAVFARGQGGLMDVALHPRYAEQGWIYLSYSEPLQGPEGSTVGHTVIARARLREQPSRRTWRSSTGCRERFYTRRLPPLRLAHPLRPRRLPLLRHRRPRPARPRPERRVAQRQDPPPPRRRLRAPGQPLRRAGGRRRVDLVLRAPQSAGSGPAPRLRPAVVRRARPQGRRRAQPHPPRPQLRLAGDHLRHQLRRHDHQRR